MKHILTYFAIFLLINFIINITVTFLVMSKKIDISKSPIYHVYMAIHPFIILFFIVMIAKDSGWKHKE